MPSSTLVWRTLWRDKDLGCNGIGLSFFMVNLSTYLLEQLRTRSGDVGVNDLKCYYRGQRYVFEIIKCLPDIPDAITCARLIEQLSGLGCIHSPGKSASNLETCGLKAGFARSRLE